MIIRQTAAGGTAGPVGSSTTFPQPVLLGDTIIVALGGFFTGEFVVFDTLGNTYHRGARTDNSIGEENSALFYAIVTNPGNCTVGAANGQGHKTIIAECVNLPTYTQGASAIGDYTPTIVGTFQRAVQTATMPLADSIIFTVLMRDLTIDRVHSDSGDTIVARQDGVPGSTILFQRAATGPGTTQSKIQSSSIGNSGVSICAMVFSWALERPDDLTQQYAVYPGQGLGPFGYETNPPSDGSIIYGSTGLGTQRFDRANFAYKCQLGNLVVVGVMQNFNSNVITVSDDYGNEYLSIITDSQEGVNICFWYTVLEFLPDADEVFVVRVDLTEFGASQIYQSSGMAIAEYAIHLAGPPAGAIYATETIEGSQARLITDPLTVIPNSLLVALSAVMSQTIQSTVWEETAGYTIQAEWNYAQSDSEVVNRCRLGMFALMDKTVDAAGDYTGEVLTDIIGENREILLIGFPFSAVPPPPPPPPPPPVCILFPVDTPRPSIVSYNEPLERQGS